MQQLATVFVLNLLTSIDNAIVIGGIAQKTRHNLMIVGLVSAIILAACRTALIMGVLSFVNIPGFRIGLGLVVLFVALRLSQISPSPQRKELSFSRLVFVIVVTDLALSVDNVVSLSVVTKNPWTVGTGVLLSLIPLLMLIPVFVNIMERIMWIQILAAGFVAELGADAITDDKLVVSRMPTGWREVVIRASVALIVILYGIWRIYHNRKWPPRQQ